MELIQQKYKQQLPVESRFSSYVRRQIDGGGTLQDSTITRRVFNIFEKVSLYDNLMLSLLPESGLNLRTSGVEQFVTKCFDITTYNRYGSQTTENSQPFLGGRIAPTEKLNFKSVTGQTKTLTHSSISVSGTYTVIKVLNAETVGKTRVTFTEVTSGSLSSISWTGRLYYYGICNCAISTVKQSLLEALFLNLFPEVEFVQIGSQKWESSNYEATHTALDFAIPEVTDGGDWSSSQTIYNSVISGGGTVKQALEASAMWCYYNNDPANGAIYGKEYNWFAIKLFQNDIDAYNLANPSTHWGWHVPSQTEFTTLQTYLGGSSVAGGKMKVTGTNYWNSPNTGANNSSLFSVLGSGNRSQTGSFSLISTYAVFFNTGSTVAYSLSYNTSEFSSTMLGYHAVRGYSLRLIKDS